VRVALVRGTQLGAWDLPNYRFGDGVQPDLFVSRGVSPEFDAADGFGVRRLPSPADVRSRLGPRFGGALDLAVGPAQYLVGLERALQGYDVAHTVELENPTTVQAIRARRAGRCGRVVASVMENIPFKRQPPPVRRTVAAAAAGVDHCVAVTERARLYLQMEGVPDDRITLLPVGTDLERFRPAESRAPGPVRIVSVARLEPGKGVEDLVIALGILARRGLEAEVTFVGSGPMRARLEQVAARLGVAEGVRFEAVPWREIERAYRAADVFVLASGPTRNWREQFGFAVVEAMACGLPTVVGDSGSLPEVVGRRESLVAPHDPLALADALEPLVRDEALRAERGAWNRRRVEERFDHRRVRAALQDLYERVLAAPPRD
jgi:glycosyltransferase involved in cell wall biosynthesis